MRIFCPEHNKSFFAPRQNPIKCGNRGHTLGEFDFEGEAKSPAEIRWQYCCNCEHLYPAGHQGLERCVVCARQVSGLHLCDRCYTLSFESNSPSQTKNFTLTSEGMPQPSCPGCLRPGSADMREHTCDELGLSFVTALRSCPICSERLDVGPGFPASVAYYLRKTRKGNKLAVTFDYESELFVPMEDGEFVLINNGNEILEPILLPRSAQFATTRDFYDFYEDYYHCANPTAGEVQIIQPVIVDAVEGGWKFKASGILEVLPDEPKKKRPLDVSHAPVKVAAREKEQPSPAAIKQKPQLTACAHCGSLVENKYAFCWDCGRPLSSRVASPVTAAEESKGMMRSATVSRDEDTLITAHSGPANRPIFSWALPRETDLPPQRKGGSRKLIALAVAGLMVFSLSLLVTRRWISNGTVPVSAQEAQVDSDPATGEGANRNAVVQPPTAEVSAPSSEEYLKKLRDNLPAAGAAPGSDVLKDVHAAESRYSDDYRFSYERAKLTVRADQTHTHHAAFAALSIAAGKAIDSGQAKEMLASMKTDSDGDFHRLSHGHDEWKQVEEALRRKDKRILGK